jgi:hypothetical protein
LANISQHSPLALEIKKEYLKQHLENVETLIETWIRELNAPAPLAPREGFWGWASVYRPVTEQLPDNNHMVRRHLRSRALWNHHTSWEHSLDQVWHLTYEVRKHATVMLAAQKTNSAIQDAEYTEDYAGVALWRGFDLSRGRKAENRYKVPDDGHGVAYGAYKIELTATSSKQRSAIEKEHWHLTCQLAEPEQMKDLTKIWREVLRLQERMQTIVDTAVKSRDILYPCRFCRHLWK